MFLFVLSRLLKASTMRGAINVCSVLLVIIFLSACLIPSPWNWVVGVWAGIDIVLVLDYVGQDKNDE